MGSEFFFDPDQERFYFKTISNSLIQENQVMAQECFLTKNNAITGLKNFF